MTEFVLDSGSQLNLLPMSEIRNQGVDVKSLPRIHLDVTGVGGAMKDTWYKLRGVWAFCRLGIWPILGCRFGDFNQNFL